MNDKITPEKMAAAMVSWIRRTDAISATERMTRFMSMLTPDQLNQLRESGNKS